MPLLKAMPPVWCMVLVCALLRLVFCGKNFADIFAAAASLTASVAGAPPWLQVILWCLIWLFVRIMFTWRHHKQMLNPCATVISRSHNGREGIVLYHGAYHTASLGCNCLVMPLCGAIVRVLACNNGHCIVCPQ